MTEPQIGERAAQTYAGLPMTVTLETIAAGIDAGWPVLFGWLARHGLAVAAAPFIRYRSVAGDGRLAIELGVPTDEPVEGDGEILGDELPAGRYATLLHAGPYDGLMAAHAALEEWTAAQGVTVDRTATDDGGEVWANRTEHYLTNPSEEPDPARWQVELTYLLGQAR